MDASALLQTSTATLVGPLVTGLVSMMMPVGEGTTANMLRMAAPVVTGAAVSTIGKGSEALFPLLPSMASAAGFMWSIKGWISDTTESLLGRQVLTDPKVQLVLGKDRWMGKGLKWIINDLVRYHPVLLDMFSTERARLEDQLVPGRMSARTAQWFTRVVVDLTGQPITIEKEPERVIVGLFMELYDTLAKIEAIVDLEEMSLGELTIQLEQETIDSINQNPTMATNRWIEATQTELRRREVEMYTKASRKITVLDNEVIPLFAKADKALDQLGGWITRLQHQSVVQTMLQQQQPQDVVTTSSMNSMTVSVGSDVAVQLHAESNRINLLYTSHSVYDAMRHVMWDTMMTFTLGVDGMEFKLLQPEALDVPGYSLVDVSVMDEEVMKLFIAFGVAMYHIQERRSLVKAVDTEELRTKGIEAMHQLSWLAQFAGDCRAQQEVLSNWNSMSVEERTNFSTPAVYIPLYMLEQAKSNMTPPHLPYSLAPPVDRLDMGMEVLKGLILQGVKAPIFTIQWRVDTGRLWDQMEVAQDDTKHVMSLPAPGDDDHTKLKPVSLFNYEKRCRGVLQAQLDSLSPDDVKLREVCIRGIERFDQDGKHRQTQLLMEFKHIIDHQTTPATQQYAINYSRTMVEEANKTSPNWGYFQSLDHATLMRLKAIPPTTQLEDLTDLLQGELNYINSMWDVFKDWVRAGLWYLFQFSVGSVSLVSLIFGHNAVPVAYGKAWYILSMVAGTVSGSVFAAMVGMFSGLCGLSKAAFESLWGVLRLIEQPWHDTRERVGDSLDQLTNMMTSLQLTSRPRVLSPIHVDLPSELLVLQQTLCVALI